VCVNGVKTPLLLVTRPAHCVLSCKQLLAESFDGSLLCFCFGASSLLAGSLDGRCGVFALGLHHAAT
jgi:hypothetical protein